MILANTFMIVIFRLRLLKPTYKIYKNDWNDLTNLYK